MGLCVDVAWVGVAGWLCGNTPAVPFRSAPALPQSWERPPCDGALVAQPWLLPSPSPAGLSSPCPLCGPCCPQALLPVLCAAAEYAELPVRHNEDKLNVVLAQQVRWGVDTRTAGGLGGRRDCRVGPALGSAWEGAGACSRRDSAMSWRCAEKACAP